MDPQPHPGGMTSHYQVLASWMCRVSVSQEGSWSWQGPSRGESIIERAT